jgi:chromosome segregation ATPase
MAGLSFMESFALGYMAAGSGPGLAETGVSVLHDLRYKRDLAQADANYTALVNEYNRLVNGINELYRHGVGLEATVARQNERIVHLEQVIADAIPRAAELEQRAATAEQRAADVAKREAEARRELTNLQERYRNARNLLAVHASGLEEAKAEIARLEAIIAGMSKPREQDSPAPNTSAS